MLSCFPVDVNFWLLLPRCLESFAVKDIKLVFSLFFFFLLCCDSTISIAESTWLVAGCKREALTFISFAIDHAWDEITQSTENDTRSISTVTVQQIYISLNHSQAGWVFDRQVGHILMCNFLYAEHVNIINWTYTLKLKTDCQKYVDTWTKCLDWQTFLKCLWLLWIVLLSVLHVRTLLQTWIHDCSFYFLSFPAARNEHDSRKCFKSIQNVNSKCQVLLSVLYN